MKENFFVRNLKLLRLMNKANLSNEEIYYLIVNYDDKQKVIEKVGLEKILSLEKDRLNEVLKINFSSEMTLFQYCFDKVFLEQKVDLIRICYELVANNFEFLQELFKVKGALDSLFDSDIKLSDEILLSEYNGKKILEYWLRRKAVTNSKVDFSSLMKNPDIILSMLEIEQEGRVNAELVLMFYEQFKIDNIDRVLLLTKAENGATLLEYLLRNGSHYLFLNPAKPLTLEMIKTFLKCNKVDLLSRFIIDNELLLENFDNVCDDSQKGSYSGTLLSYLLDNNVDYPRTDLLSFEAILVYIDKNKISYLNKKVLQDEVLLHPYQGKTLLDYLYEQNINVDLRKCKNPQIFKICFKNKKFDLFINATDDILDIIVEDNKTVFDLMLENGVFPWKKTKIPNLENNPQNAKKVLSLLKYGYYERVLEVDGSILSYEVDSINHKTIFDIVLEKSSILNNFSNKDELIEILEFIKFNSEFEGISKFSSEVLLLEYDTKNHLTILDLALKKWDIKIFFADNKNLLNRTEIAEMGAKNGFLGINILKYASKEVLLHKVPSLGNRTILQLILDKEKSKVLDIYSDFDLSKPNIKKKFEQDLTLFWSQVIDQIDQNILSDPEIMYTIFIATGSTKCLKYSMEKAQDLGLVTHEMIESSMWQTDGVFGPLDAESETLLQEFVAVMKTGTKSDEEVINLAVMSFRKLIMRNDSLGEFDLRRIIEVKKANPDFHLKYNKDRGSCYNPKDCCIYINNKYDIGTFEHELTHMFNHHYAARETPKEFSEIIKRCISAQGFEDRVLLFMKEFYNDYDEHDKSYLEDFWKKYITDYAELISDQFFQILKNVSEQKIIISLLNKGIKDETIWQILEILKDNLSNEKKSKIISEYLKQLLIKDQSSYAIEKLDYHFRNEMNVTNFLDAILRGSLSELIGKEMGQIAFVFHQHGVEYFCQDERLVFDEVLAIYVSIRKSDNSEELIGRLREIVGDELVDYLENYYVSQLTMATERRK